MKVALTGAEALFWDRLAGDPSPLELGAMKAHCAAVFRDVAEDAIQLHGGIGLTQERVILTAEQEVSITNLQRSVASLRAGYGAAIEQFRCAI